MHRVLVSTFSTIPSPLRLLLRNVGGWADRTATIRRAFSSSSSSLSSHSSPASSPLPPSSNPSPPPPAASTTHGFTVVPVSSSSSSSSAGAQRSSRRSHSAGSTGGGGEGAVGKRVLIRSAVPLSNRFSLIKDPISGRTVDALETGDVKPNPTDFTIVRKRKGLRVRWQLPKPDAASAAALTTGAAVAPSSRASNTTSTTVQAPSTPSISSHVGTRNVDHEAKGDHTTTTTTTTAKPVAVAVVATSSSSSPLPPAPLGPTDAVVAQVEYDFPVTTLSAEFLRAHVPSTDVTGSGSTHYTLVYGKRGITITDMFLVGNYAVRMTFSDGHDAGIFPYGYLWELSGSGIPGGKFSLMREYIERLRDARRRRDPPVARAEGNKRRLTSPNHAAASSSAHGHLDLSGGSCKGHHH